MRYLVLFASLGLFSCLAKSSEVELAVGEWAPLVSETAPGHGIIPQRLAASFKNLALRPKYRFFPWNRAYKLVENGQFLLSVGWIKNKQRSKEVLFSKRPIFETETALFHLKSKKINFKNFKDLQGLRIGVTRDYAQGIDFAAAIKEYDLQIEYASSDELNMKKLLSGRIDVFPIDRSVGHQLLKKMFNSESEVLIVDHSKAVAQEKLWLIATKNEQGQKLLQEFDRIWSE